MELFLDNDIILKLASADLLQEIEKIFNTDPKSIYILPTAKHYVLRNKKLKKKYSQEELNNALSFISNYSIIPDDYINQERFISLSNIENIDTGEQALFAVLPKSVDFLILTGDKTALVKLYKQPNLDNIKKDLAGKIVCLESIILMLLELNSFEEISKKIIDSNYCGDIALEIIFSQTHMTLENVQFALNSYYRDLKKQTGDLLL